jgi:hypothetical protein
MDSIKESVEKTLKAWFGSPIRLLNSKNAQFYMYVYKIQYAHTRLSIYTY